MNKFLKTFLNYFFLYKKEKNFMDIKTNGRLIEIDNMTNSDILGGTFRNFTGEKRIAKNGKYAGRIVNDEGKRNFNIKIPDDAMEYFMSIGANIGEFGGNPDEGEPPVHYFKVNVKTDSNIPPHLYMLSSTGKMNEMDVKSYAKLDGMNIEYAHMTINTSFKYDSPAFYLQSAEFKPQYDPITEKFQMQMEINDVEPTIPDEMPFEE